VGRPVDCAWHEDETAMSSSTRFLIELLPDSKVEACMRYQRLGVMIVAMYSAIGVTWSVPARSADENSTPSSTSPILVELALAADQKDTLPAIKEAFSTMGITKVRAQIYRAGRPPTNIAIGRDVPAPIARLAFRLAQEYNGGVTLLLPEERLAPNYIAFGSSIFDELFQYPISQEGVARLTDPSLTTEQFHDRYRQLADITTRRERR
jgi:hypothetical protein